jgi:hypothetical protein
VVFAHPDLVHLTKYPTPYYMDGTFRTARVGFEQQFIVMIWDNAYSIYIPVFYVLLQDKSAWSYQQAINFCWLISNYKMSPSSITCDFEQALMNEVSNFFRKPDLLVGCLFHLKQAWRRRLVQLNVSASNLSAIMAPGGLDLLCYIPIAEIEKKGIVMNVYMYIRNCLYETKV